MLQTFNLSLFAVVNALCRLLWCIKGLIKLLVVDLASLVAICQYLAHFCSLLIFVLAPFHHFYISVPCEGTAQLPSPQQWFYWQKETWISFTVQRWNQTVFITLHSTVTVKKLPFTSGVMINVRTEPWRHGINKTTIGNNQIPYWYKPQCMCFLFLCLIFTDPC